MWILGQFLAQRRFVHSVARDAVLEVDAAWTNLEFILKDAESQILLGQNLAASLNQASRSELVQAREAIASLREKIEQDPLGVSAEIDGQIKPLLAQVKLGLEQAQKQQAQIQEKLAIALRIGNNPGQSNSLFEEFKAANGKTFDINQAAFDQVIHQGFSNLNGFEIKTVIAVSTIVLLTFFGSLPRLKEYSN